MCANDDVSVKDIQALVENGGAADINSRDAKGRTPLLCYLAAHTSAEVPLSGLEMLMENGADASLVAHDGTSVLDYVQGDGATKARELLLNAGVNLSGYDGNKKPSLNVAA